MIGIVSGGRMIEENQGPSGRSELIKFLLLIVVMAVTVGVVSWSRPLIFDRIVPAVMGDTDVTTVDGAGEVEEDTAVNEENESSAESGTEDAAASDETDAAAADEETAADDSEVSSETVEDDSEVVEDNAAETAVEEQTTHVVQPGETVFAIARRYNVTVAEIVAANDLTNPNRVAVGQTLIIPQP